MNELRLKINHYLKENIKDGDSVALLFSGGTDSLTCLFSLLELGVKPSLYTFHLENIIHKDVEISKMVSEYYSLNHTIITIKKDEKQLIRDVYYIINNFKTTRKTNIQCTYPFLHILPKIKEKYIVSGIGADDLYGSTKSMGIKCSNDKEIFDNTRKKILSNPYSSAVKPISELIVTYDKVSLMPYRDNKIIDYFMKFSWEELNKPKQKQIAINSYSKYYSNQNIYRRNDNLQVGSKIREWHNTLIFSDINKFNRKRVDEIYKDIGKEKNNEFERE